MYILLCGYPPFNGPDEPAILRAVEDGAYHFDEPDWAEVSPEGKDLLTKMFEKDPKKRISAKLAYDHPWIK